MHTKTNKTILLLVGILAISLISGNVLLADNFTKMTGIVASDDLDSISKGYSANAVSDGSRYYEDFSASVPAQDLEFVSESFNPTVLSSSGSVYSEYTGSDIVDGLDINFVRNGALGSDTANLVCVVQGVQATGKACVN